MRGKIVLFCLVLFVIIASIFVGTSFTKIDVGERGVEVRLGKVVGEHKEGILFYNFLTTKVFVFDVREKIYTPAPIKVFSKDAQGVSLVLAVNYYPDRNKMSHFFSEYERNYLEQIVPPVVHSVVKEISGKFNAVDMITQREKLQNEISDKIQSELAKKFIHVTKVSIVGLDLNRAFTEAVEQKVIAVQEAERAKNVTQRIEEEAKQKIISAEADAKAMEIKSKALKENKGLVEYNAVEKWDGKLPVYMMGNAVPFINLNKMNKSE